jgi:4-amino-4-deoxy-L-arabinose transferase-like glycosyltransferase
VKRWFARPHATILAIWILVGVIPLPVREVMPPDESRFTHQAQNMRENGEWIVPKIGDVPNSDKPPVIFWLANLFSLGADRVTATGARVQSALGALLTAFLTLRLGRRLFDR